MLAQRQSEEEAQRFESRVVYPTLPSDLRESLEDIGPALPELWTSGKISNEHKKRLLRSLISRVIATRTAADRIEVKIVWISEHSSVTQVIPPIYRQKDSFTVVKNTREKRLKRHRPGAYHSTPVTI